MTIFTALAYFAHSTIPKENREFLVVYPLTRQDNNAKTQNLHLLRQQLIYRLVVVFVNFTPNFELFEKDDQANKRKTFSQ